MKRKAGQVGPVEGYEDMVLGMIRSLEADCSAECQFAFSYLHKHDPDPNHYCGEMNRQWLLYAMKMESCEAWRFVVSIPTDMSIPCFIHGLVPSGGDFRQIAFNLAAPQLGVQNKPWDKME